jgi:dihydroorotate dehydrogenase
VSDFSTSHRTYRTDQIPSCTDQDPPCTDRFQFAPSYTPLSVSLYTRALRPALFALDAERAHDLTMAALRQPLVLNALRGREKLIDHRLSQQVFGLEFSNPLGLGAGLDKQGTAVPAWAALGFGFAEIGTVTPQPQPGNPKPRLFRLRRDRAIINRFGFNSEGAEGVARNLADGTPGRGVLRPGINLRVGINIGKNKETPNERAADDYVRTVDLLHPFADYFAINVSSPNTAGLRDLQDSRTLRALVEQVVARVGEKSAGRAIPVLVKMSPDAPDNDLLRSVEASVEGGAAGVIATNTTVARPALENRSDALQAGGLSGAPLRSTANAVCGLLFRHLGRRIPIVGVGGIFTADDAYERIRSGAALVQIYTALVYEGPGMVHSVLTGLAARLSGDGFSRIEEAIGIDVQ